MTTTAPIPPITGTVTVGLPVEQAFRVFTASFDTWWPHEYHIGQSEVAEVIPEPRGGGRWFERGVDGTERDWGRVLAWEPPHRLLFTWQINGMMTFDPDPAHASEIEARFIPDGSEQSIVEVKHRHFDRLIGGEAVRTMIQGGGGWVQLLDGYTKTVANQP
ncbi:SRPBCC family protein [Pseudonocardia spinosispora]|uniref:SRPBCC family protein n=1 Tax=Pseudonocardia spinosispora TaxID=103441 RepID=UPI00040D6C70|nr:SRPBCC family protein [Pseudonocardia spinosispora]